MKHLKLTIRYAPTKDGDGFIGMCPELLGVISQGKTLDELKDNLLDAAIIMMAHSRFETIEESEKRFGSYTWHEMDLVSGFNSLFELFPPKESSK